MKVKGKVGLITGGGQGLANPPLSVCRRRNRRDRRKDLLEQVVGVMDALAVAVEYGKEKIRCNYICPGNASVHRTNRHSAKWYFTRLNTGENTKAALYWRISVSVRLRIVISPDGRAFWFSSVEWRDPSKRLFAAGYDYPILIADSNSCLSFRSRPS